MMDIDGNIDGSVANASYMMAPDGRFHLFEHRRFTVGDVRVSVRDQVIYYEPPASQFQEEMLCDQAESLDWPLYQDWGKTTKPIWLPVIMEGLECLTFTNEVTDAHGGEMYATLYAREGETVVGYIEYSLYEGEVNVKYIHVNEDKRRGGIATAMARSLQASHPESEINWGGLTDEGSAFLRALNRDFEPDATYAELKLALDNAKAEYAALQAEMEAQDFTAMSPEQKQPFLAKGERMNDLDDLIFSLEDQIRDRKPGKWRVMTESEMNPRQMANFVRQALTLTGDWVSEQKEVAVGTVTDWTLRFEDLSGRLVGSYAFLRDEGNIDYADNTRHVWFIVKLTSPCDKEMTDAFGDKYDIIDYDRIDYDRIDYDTNLRIKPEPEEFEQLKASIKEGFFRALKSPVLSTRHFNLYSLKPRLDKIYTRILQSFDTR